MRARYMQGARNISGFFSISQRVNIRSVPLFKSLSDKNVTFAMSPLESLTEKYKRKALESDI